MQLYLYPIVTSRLRVRLSTEVCADSTQNWDRESVQHLLRRSTTESEGRGLSPSQELPSTTHMLDYLCLHWFQTIAEIRRIAGGRFLMQLVTSAVREASLDRSVQKPIFRILTCKQCGQKVDSHHRTTRRMCHSFCPSTRPS